MYIEPGTDIYLFQSVPLDNTYDNSIVFATPTAQFEFFVNNPLYNAKHYVNQTYQRLERGYMMLQAKADELVAYNYCAFRNTRYSSKWWYAFVQRVEWVNNEVARVDIEIDVIQTWYFHTVLDSCFVERQHADHDVAGDNLLPESFELGEYVSTGVERSGVNLRELVIVVARAPKIWGGQEAHFGYLYSNTYSGLVYQTYPATVAGADQMGLDLWTDYSSHPDSIVSIFMCPKVIAEALSNPAENDSNIISAANHATLNKYSEYGTTDIFDGFAFNNQKLLTYPYCFLYVTNGVGNAAVYPYEYFLTDNCQFDLYGAMSPNPAGLLVPRFYKGASLNWDEGLQISGWPQCAWTSDTFRAYVAQIAASAVGGAASILGNAGLGVGVGVTGAAAVVTAPAIAPVAAGAAVAAIGSIVSAATKAAIQPTQMQGSQQSSPVIAAGMLDYCFMHKKIRPEYARIIDGYWDAYGYPQRLEMVPNRTARRYFTYVKTIGCHVRGNISAETNKKICDIYDHGIRFWKPDARHIGDVADMATENVPTP